MVAGLKVYGSSLNESHSPVDLRPRLNQLNRYTGAAAPPAEQRRSTAAMVTHWTWASHALQGSILDVVGTISTGALSQACFLKLGRWCGGSLVYLWQWGKH
jgi:hypothetical protein